MAVKTNGLMLKELGLIAMQDCTCTEEQESGEIFPGCDSCEVRHALNKIGEDIGYEYRRFFPEGK